MTEIEYFLHQDEDVVQPTQPLVDFTSRVFIPVLTVLATIVVGWNARHPYILLGLITMTVLSLIVGPMQWLVSIIRVALNRMQDRRAAREYFTKLRKLADRFGDFVNSGKPDTLHYITESHLCEGHGQRIAALGLPNMAAWSGRSDLFSSRLGLEKDSVRELQYAVLEFHDLVGTYVNLCATAVFGRLPQDLFTNMSPRARTELGAFQQRFERFLSDSEQLLKEISQSRQSFSRLPCSFAAVKPLP
jgi:hypothetical protein